MKPVEQLCLSCGMCCDGSLFDNVLIAESESLEALKSTGLPVRFSRAKKPVPFLRQPCTALCSDKTCRVYQERPEQCRSFECQVYKDLEAEQIALESACRVVRQGRRKADAVRRLLDTFEGDDRRLSLSKRFKRVQRQLESGALEPEDGERFAELGLAMHQFDLFAHRRFYTVEPQA